MRALCCHHRSPVGQEESEARRGHVTWSWGANPVLPPPGLFCSASQERLSLGPSPEAGGTDVLPSCDLGVATGPLRGLSRGTSPGGRNGLGGAVGLGLDSGRGSWCWPSPPQQGRSWGCRVELSAVGGHGFFHEPPRQALLIEPVPGPRCGPGHME